MHYSVLVVTDERPTQQIIARALRPFREEPEDEFLQDVDVTESARERFLAASGTMLDAPDGTLHDAFAEQFYREPTLSEDRLILACRGMNGAMEGVRFEIKSWSDGFLAARVRTVPDGWREVPNPKGHNQTFAEFAADYHGVGIAASEDGIDRGGDHSNGYVLLDGCGEVDRVVVRTNPQGHYDYYDQPGRFSGILRHLGGRDICQRKDLKLDESAKEYAQKRREWATWIIGRLALGGTDELRKLVIDLAHARKDWLKERKDREPFREWLLGRDLRLLADLDEACGQAPVLDRHPTMEEWFDAARPLWVYAIVSAGVWHERERTPWWRDMSGDDDIWAEAAWNIVSALPGEKWLTVVDCHN